MLKPSPEQGGGWVEGAGVRVNAFLFPQESVRPSLGLEGVALPMCPAHLLSPTKPRLSPIPVTLAPQLLSVLCQEGV